MSESGDATHVSTPHVADSEDFYGSESEEVVLKTRDAPHEPITQKYIRELIECQEEKFSKISEGVRALEINTNDVHTHMDIVMRENRVRENAQVSTNKQMKSIQEALARFMEAYDPARQAPVSTCVKSCAPTMETLEPARQTPIRTLLQPRAPTMSMPISPPGAPPKFRSEFSFASPVNQATPAVPTRGDRDRDLNERPTHENGNGIGGDTQITMNTSSGLNNTATRHESSPKVPIFDGTVSAHFRPWLIQFEAIARHQCWTSGEKVVRLVASLTGPTANMFIGMTMGQLDDYAFLAAHLSRRYDPPEREEAHRAELRARTRRQNESADEFAENLKNLAQRAYPNADQNMLDNLVVERFREGHNNIELKKHLCLYPSTGLQDLIGACVRFETHVELGTRSYKPNEGMYTVKGNEPTELSFDDVALAARKLGYQLRPWADRQENRPQGNSGYGKQDNRGYGGPNRYQNGGNPQQWRRFSSNGNTGARTSNRRQIPLEEIKCWTCGKLGHYASDCTTTGPKFAYAPKVVRMNYLQDMSENVEYVEAAHDNDMGNE